MFDTLSVKSLLDLHYSGCKIRFMFVEISKMYPTKYRIGATHITDDRFVSDQRVLRARDEEGNKFVLSDKNAKLYHGKDITIYLHSGMSDMSNSPILANFVDYADYGMSYQEYSNNSYKRAINNISNSPYPPTIVRNPSLGSRLLSDPDSTPADIFASNWEMVATDNLLNTKVFDKHFNAYPHIIKMFMKSTVEDSFSSEWNINIVSEGCRLLFNAINPYPEMFVDTKGIFNNKISVEFAGSRFYKHEQHQNDKVGLYVRVPPVNKIRNTENILKLSGVYRLPTPRRTWRVVSSAYRRNYRVINPAKDPRRHDILDVITTINVMKRLEYISHRYSDISVNDLNILTYVGFLYGYNDYMYLRQFKDRRHKIRRILQSESGKKFIDYSCEQAKDRGLSV